ncbi:MAG: hemerythrin domain-containing protein [Aestuariivirga sp.]
MPDKLDEWRIRVVEERQMSGDLSNMVDTLGSYLQQQGQLCDRLEEIADSLPDSADGVLCIETANQMVRMIKSAHSFEEEELFPAIMAAVEDRLALEPVFGRLKFEHWEDEENAACVQEALCTFAVRRADSNVESLSWMLRGLFECLRRHIAFERDHVLPMAISLTVKRLD